MPPGLRTRWASFSTAGMDVQFRIPNAMVYRSYAFEGMCDMSCAFASVKDTCWAGNNGLAGANWKVERSAYCCGTSSS